MKNVMEKDGLSGLTRRDCHGACQKRSIILKRILATVIQVEESLDESLVFAEGITNTYNIDDCPRAVLTGGLTISCVRSSDGQSYLILS
jgi:hypothetical protein